jgi:hypothetical protein
MIWVLERDLEGEGEDEGVGVGMGVEVGKEMRLAATAVVRDEDGDVVKDFVCEEDVLVVVLLLVVKDCELELVEALEIVVVVAAADAKTTGYRSSSGHPVLSPWHG